MSQLTENTTPTPATIQGAGVGLRACHYQHILQYRPEIPWFETLTDNYLVQGGPALQYLTAIREHYPMVLHGVSLSIGSVDPLNQTYLQGIKQLADRIEPAWISDHLCWSSTQGQYLPDLLPLPYTEEALDHVVTRIQQVQETLNSQILIENVSSYLQYECSEMTEWEFINTIAERADCYILLDVNNIYVSAHNHQFDPTIYLNHINTDRVKQFHLAGFTDKQDYLFDNHGAKVHEPVWDLYAQALQRFGNIPTVVEWDDTIPPFTVLEAEAKQAQTFMDQAEEALLCC